MKLFRNFFVFLLLLFFTSLLFPLKTQTTDDQVLSILSDTYQKSGLLQFSNSQNISIVLDAKNIQGKVKLSIYKANPDTLLNFLVHDEDYYQINKKLNSDKLDFYKELEVEVFDKSKKKLNLPIDELGIYFLKAELADLEAQAFIVKSDFATLVKEGKNDLIFWSQDFNTKKSINTGTVKVYNLKDQINLISESDIDQEGIAHGSLTSKADLAVIEHEGKNTIVPINALYLNTGYFWSSFENNSVQKRFFVFTDRPIYKPGDTVFFKAIIRDDDDGRYSIPAGQVDAKAYIGWENPNYLHEKSYYLDQSGTVNGKFTVPETSKTGYYTLKISTPEDQKQQEQFRYYSSGNTVSFKVAPYRKPEYFLNIETDRQEVIRGDNLKIIVKGQYFSGKPLANSEIKYKVYAKEYSAYQGEYYYPPSNKNYYRTWGGKNIKEGTATLDSKGKVKINLPTNENDSSGHYQTFSLEVNYTDQSGNPAFVGKNFLIKDGEFSIYRQDNKYYSYQPKQKIDLPLVLKPNTDQVDLQKNIKVSVVRKWWKPIAQEDRKYPRWVEENENILETEKKSDLEGKFSLDLTPEDYGTYIFTVETEDDRGNTIKKSFRVWVSSHSYVSAGNQSNTILALNTNKKTYLPGDQVEISLQSFDGNGDVFLSFDRAYTYKYWVLDLNDQKATLKTLLEDQDMPNTFISARTFTNDSLASSYFQISVSPEKQRLDIQLKTDKEEYGPGDQVTVNLFVRDQKGNPTAANLALWTVDKAIFELADKNYSDIFQSFWKERYNNTQESNSFRGIYIGGGAEMGGCFLEGTKVLMSDNSLKNIEDIKPGEKVLTRAGTQDSSLVKATVLKTHQTKESSYLIINKNLKLTSNHLVNINKNWTPAANARLGDTLLTKDGQEMPITSIEWSRGQVSVHNLVVEKYHTYFAQNYWVHNDKGGGEREHFADAAYWNPTINIDQSGHSQVKFKLPDNLTTWVIAAIANTQDTKVNETFTEIKVSKDLVIRPILPNILRQKDKVTFSALIHNFTDQEGVFTASFKNQDLKISSPTDHTIEVSKNDFKQIDWQFTIPEDFKGETEYVFSVVDQSSEDKKDTVTGKIEVEELGFWQKESQFKIGSTEYRLLLPKKTDHEKSSVELEISSTIVGTLPSAMKYLINYPYGCNEQITSSMVPLLILKRNPKLSPELAKEKDIDAMIESGIKKLQKNQNSDGGWGWWHNSSKLFITAYVVEQLNEARSLGFPVNSALENAKSFLSKNWEKKTREEKIISAWGLSFYPDSDLPENLESIDPDSLPADLLALFAIVNQKYNPNDQGALNALLQKQKNTGESVYWEKGSETYFSSVDTSTSFAIKALLGSEKYQDTVTRAVRYLINVRNKNYWSHTFATTRTIKAISDYANKYKESSKDMQYTVLIDGKQFTSGSIKKTIDIPLEKLGSSSKITVNNSSSSNLYSTLTSSFWVKDDSLIQPLDQGIKISRHYINDKGEQYSFAPGDLVTVRLDIEIPSLSNNKQTTYALIEDHLPSGMVPVIGLLKNERYDKSNNHYYSVQNYQKDGVIIPIYYITDKKTSFEYKARIVVPGEFVVPPATASLMYQPETRGRTGFDQVKIDKESKIIFTKVVQNKIKEPLRTGLAVKFVFGSVLLIFLIKTKTKWKTLFQKIRKPKQTR